MGRASSPYRTDNQRYGGEVCCPCQANAWFCVRARKRRCTTGIDLSRRRRAIRPTRCRRVVLSRRRILPCVSHAEHFWRPGPRM